MDEKLLILILLILTFVIVIAGYFYQDNLINNKLLKVNSDNIQIEKNRIYFNSLTLKQKISQMIIVRGDNSNDIQMTDFNIGGIFLDRETTFDEYKTLIDSFQNNSKIKLIVSTDMEGDWNPFSKFRNFSKFSDIPNSTVALSEGREQGKLLKELGFNLNLAPVSEYVDNSYGGGRVFHGSEIEIQNKLTAYIYGLQESVPGACKHYPGKGMIANLHLEQDSQEIELSDIKLFSNCMKNNISAIMIGHQIVNGKIDSNGKSSSVSPEVIGTLNDFNGLIISDEVNMKGLKKSYSNKVDMYMDLINSGENVILDFNLDLKSLFELLDSLEKKVKAGEIDEEKIDTSVKKILFFKGYKV